MYYTESHEWASIQGKVATIGITDHAQKELGEIVFVELPQVGHHVKQGDEAAVLESTKAAADVYAPISGKVLAVNAGVKADPSLLYQFAESKGWLFQIEMSDPKELQSLLKKEQYLSQIFP